MPALQEITLDNPVRTTGWEDPVLCYRGDGGCDVLFSARPSGVYQGPWDHFSWDLARPETVYRSYQGNIPTRRYNFHLAPWRTVPVGDGRFATFGFITGRNDPISSWGGTIVVYDPVEHTLSIPPEATSPHIWGETHNLSIATDGMLVAAAGDENKRTCVFLYDPRTRRVVGEWSGIGDMHNPSNTNGVAADDTHIYVIAGRVPYQLYAVHRLTGEATLLLDTGIIPQTLGQLRHGVALRVGTTPFTNYWLYAGKLLPKSGTVPPWSNGSVLPESAWVPTFTKPAFNTAGLDNLPQQTDRMPTVRYTWGGKTYTVRLDAPAYTPAVSRVCAFAPGLIVGGVSGYAGLIDIEAATGAVRWVANTSLSLYAMAKSGSKVYLAGYPNGALYEWDTGRANTTGSLRSNQTIVGDLDTDANPRRVLSCQADTSPKTLSTYLIDVCIWKKWAAACGYDSRNGTGWGVLVTRDMQAGVNRSWQDGLHALVPDCVRASADGRWLALSCHRGADGTGIVPKPESGAILVFDATLGDGSDIGALLARKSVPVRYSKGAGRLLPISGSRFLGWCAPPARNADGTYSDSKTVSILYVYDAATGEVMYQREHALACPWNYSLGGESSDMVYANGAVFLVDGTARQLMRVNVSDLSLSIVGTLTSGGQATVDGTDLYLAGPRVRRIPDVLR
jgi:hypothetical protein